MAQKGVSVGMIRFISRVKWVLRKLPIFFGGLFVLLLVVNAILVWQTDNQLEERIATLRAAGAPATLSEFQHSAPPPDRDAAVFLDRAQPDIEAFLASIEEVQASPVYAAHELSDGDRKALEALFDKFPAMLPLLEQAAGCPEFQSRFEYTASVAAIMKDPAPDSDNCRRAMNVMDTRVRLLLAQSKPDEALNLAVTMFRLCRRIENRPLQLGQITVYGCRRVAIDCANRSLRAGPVSDRTRRLLDDELAAAERKDGYLFGLRTECAFDLDVIRGHPDHYWLTRAYFNTNQANVIDVINQFIALADRPFAEVKSIEGQYKSEWEVIRHYFSRILLWPAITKVREIHDRALAGVRCLRVFNALQTRPGEPALSDLGLPGSALIDPFNGEMLRAKKLPNGWLIYSVGENLIDDGGDFDKNKDVGVGPVDK